MEEARTCEVVATLTPLRCYWALELRTEKYTAYIVCEIENYKTLALWTHIYSSVWQR
jgi:hypothetical protein